MEQHKFRNFGEKYRPGASTPVGDFFIHREPLWLYFFACR
jgi:hypothetical protein